MPSTNIRWADESASTSERVAEFLEKALYEQKYLITKPFPIWVDDRFKRYYKDSESNIYTCNRGTNTPSGCHFCNGCGQITPTPGCFNPTSPRRPDMCVCTDSEMVNVRSHQRRKPNTANQKVEVIVATLSEDPLSNAQQRLEQQKIITDKAAIAAKDAEDGRAKARMVLEEAQKTFSDSVKNEEEAKVTETETASVLVALQREVDELIYAARREEIANKKRLIKETYEAQLADIEADELSLGHM